MTSYDSADQSGAPRAPLSENEVEVVVLAAMPEEAAPFVSRLEGATEVSSPLSAISAWTGSVDGRRVAVVTTGIGISAASAATTWAALTFSPRLLISAGSTGGLAADIEVGAVVLGEEYSYSIADATAFGYAPGQVPGSPARFTSPPALVNAAWDALTAVAPELAMESPDDEPAAGAGTLRRGLMLSGDAFVTADIAAPMRQKFPEAISADMESTGIVRTAQDMGLDVLVIRSVSDLCGPTADQQFHVGIERVSHISAQAVTAVLRTLP